MGGGGGVLGSNCNNFNRHMKSFLNAGHHVCVPLHIFTLNISTVTVYASLFLFVLLCFPLKRLRHFGSLLGDRRGVQVVFVSFQI